MEEDRSINTEENILKCAEEVFLERGFDGAKTTEIAGRAGVNHAMIHYYFRTKQNLFDVIFKSKAELLASSFASALMEDLPFFDKIQRAIEVHFDFLMSNPKLPFFLYTEVVNNKDRKVLLIKVISSKVKGAISEFEYLLNDEIARGTVRKVNVIELLMNIVALNITTFLALPLMEVLLEEQKIEEILTERKANNVEFIINSLKLDRAKPKYTQTSLDFGF